jgi:hypothetical protein
LSRTSLPPRRAAGALAWTSDQADGLFPIGKGFVRLMTPSGISSTLGLGSVLGEDSLPQPAL